MHSQIKDLLVWSGDDREDVEVKLQSKVDVAEKWGADEVQSIVDVEDLILIWRSMGEGAFYVRCRRKVEMLDATATLWS